jgi:hypothetical protein
MLILMVIIFGSTWLPLNLINLITDLNLFQMHCWRYYHASFIGCHLMAMSSSVFNPFIYGNFNDSFRKEFLTIFPQLRIFCGSRETIDEEVHPNLQLIEMPVMRTGLTTTARNTSQV